MGCIMLIELMSINSFVVSYLGYGTFYANATLGCKSLVCNGKEYLLSGTDNKPHFSLKPLPIMVCMVFSAYFNLILRIPC